MMGCSGGAELKDKLKVSDIVLYFTINPLG